MGAFSGLVGLPSAGGVGTGPGWVACGMTIAPTGGVTIGFVGEVGVHVPDGTKPGCC